MSLRLLVYVGLLYQDLVKRNELSPEGMLPPVLPIVLYNGMQRWTAATDLRELTLSAPVSLAALQPMQRYLLIDESAFDPAELDSKTNLAAALFRLEHSRTPEDLRRVIINLKGWLGAPAQTALRQSLKRWALRLLRRKLKDDSIPEVADLLEIDNMLAERIENWAEEWKRQGQEAGHKQGFEQGIQEGLERGREKGLEQGIVQGIEEGVKQGIEQGVKQGIEQGVKRGIEQGVKRGIEQGRLQGEAHLLRCLIERRFGSIPAWAETKLAEGTELQLLSWSEKIFDASTLAQLFAD